MILDICIAAKDPYTRAPLPLHRNMRDEDISSLLREIIENSANKVAVRNRRIEE
jgi:hypothetical protein